METRDYMVAVVDCVGKRRITRNPKHVIICKNVCDIHEKDVIHRKHVIYRGKREYYMFF